MLLTVEQQLSALSDPASELPSIGSAWDLLARAEQRDPAALRDLLLAPQTGLWLAQLLRRLGRRDDTAPRPGEVPLWVDAGYMFQLAAGAAVAARLDFRIHVPLRNGSVVLPGLGQATLHTPDSPTTTSAPDDLPETDNDDRTHAPAPAPAPAPAAWTVAEVQAESGSVRITSHGRAVVLPGNPEGEGTDEEITPGWAALRKLRSSSNGCTLAVTLDDLGPYGLTETAPPLPRVDRAVADRWQRLLDVTWSLLVAQHPRSARALAAGLLSLMPLPQGELLRPRSASTSDAFGCVLVSEPEETDDHDAAVQLAVALIHEFRHTLLNGLIFQVALFDDCPESFHAPWRDDPRPLGGLVHGAYSFAGVTNFWRDRLLLDHDLDHGAAKELAAFEFALWRRQTWSVLGDLDSHPALTGPGRMLVRSLQSQTQPWLVDPVSERPLRSAELAARHHRAAWRTHHMSVPERATTAIAAAWATGTAVPPTETTESSVLRADPQACRLDIVAVLARLRIVDPQEFQRLGSRPGLLEQRIPGATPADLALVSNDYTDAVKLYEEELGGATARVSAWAGLGLALAGSGADRNDAAARLLADRPEFVAAVFRAISVNTPQSVPSSPVQLARWLARPAATATATATDVTASAARCRSGDTP